MGSLFPFEFNGSEYIPISEECKVVIDTHSPQEDSKEGLEDYMFNL